MKHIEKILLGMIIAVLLTWGICWAADTKLTGLSQLAQADNDDLFYMVDDANGVPAMYKIPREEALISWPGSTNVTTLGTVTTGSINKIAADESADATLTALGQVHIRGDEDRFSAHLGAGGEIAGEATVSFVKSIFVTFDPGSVYDSNSIVPLPKISSKQYPNGIIIDAWEVNCHMNPDVEMNFNLGYSVNPMDMADPNLVDVLDTTNGQSSEDTDASINGGSAIPANTYMMLYFDADPEGTCTTLSVQIWYHGEED